MKTKRKSSLAHMPLFACALILFLCVVGDVSLTKRAAAQSTPGIKTDRAVYPEPPLPTLPSKGGKFTDPVFGTQIMRATDATDYPTPGCGTSYNQWPTFNSNNTRILIRCGDSGDMIIKAFDPVNFTLGTTVRKTFGGGTTQIPTIGGEYAQWQGATWSRTDPDKIWVVPGAPNAGGSTNKGPQIYTYSVLANTYTPVKSFVSLFAAGQVFFRIPLRRHGNYLTFVLPRHSMYRCREKLMCLRRETPGDHVE